MTEKNGLDILREPFEPHQISKLPKPTCKAEDYRKLPKGKCGECGGYHATSKTIHLDYVGHAALTDRLLDADPKYTWEPLALTDDGLPLFDKSGGLWIKLTVCGVTRLGYGHAKTNQYAEVGSREKEVIGDALRNAAMRFGAALDLWHKGPLHGFGDDDDQEPKDKKGKYIPPNQQGKIKAGMVEAGMDPDAFLHKLGVKNFEEIPFSWFDNIMKDIEKEKGNG
jgi:hypothetical protein